MPITNLAEGTTITFVYSRPAVWDVRQRFADLNFTVTYDDQISQTHSTTEHNHDMTRTHSPIEVTSMSHVSRTIEKIRLATGFRKLRSKITAMELEALLLWTIGEGRATIDLLRRAIAILANSDDGLPARQDSMVGPADTAVNSLAFNLIVLMAGFKTSMGEFKDAAGHFDHAQTLALELSDNRVLQDAQQILQRACAVFEKVLGLHDHLTQAMQSHLRAPQTIMDEKLLSTTQPQRAAPIYERALQVASAQNRAQSDYKIACICQLGVELAPVLGMLDTIHDPLPTGRLRNAYTLGSIGDHDIVIATMPEIGTNGAATVVTQLLYDFPNIHFGFLVGIGGGVPGDADVRLGDVVVGQTSGTSPAVVQYDLGKGLEGGQFIRRWTLNRPPTGLSANVRKLNGQHRRQGHDLLEHISKMCQKYPQMEADYQRPALQDHLFSSTYVHHSGENCQSCDVRYTIPRPARTDDEPRIHYGTIGSSNKVMKDAGLRDRIRTETHALCIEMEAAGLMSDFPCLVIRGVSDYADSHKNEKWQPYAAAVAAAYMKALLLIILIEEAVLAGRTFEHTFQLREKPHDEPFDDHAELHSSGSGFHSPGRRQELVSSDKTKALATIYPGLVHRMWLPPTRELNHAERARTTNAGAVSETNHHTDYDTSSSTQITALPVMINHTNSSSRDPQQATIDSTKFDILARSLRFDRFNFLGNNIKGPLASTCQWLLHHSKFQRWYNRQDVNEHGGFLWIKGKPGCGKSTLMKATFEWVQRQHVRGRASETVISYFFDARASASPGNSRLGLYCTIVHHLVHWHPAFQRAFTARFSLKDINLAEDDWTVEELEDFLKEVVESNESFKLYLFVDALDEAEYYHDVQQMIRFLGQLCERSTSAGAPCKLWICLSSRFYPHIQIRKCLSLVVEEQSGHFEDIEVYIAKELHCDDGFEGTDLRNALLSKSGGVFLWVVLVVRILNQLYDQKAQLLEVKTRLETIPDDLNGLFVEILTRHDWRHESSMLLFQWMVFRMRALEQRNYSLR